MHVKGIHHLSAITADAPLNLDFYTQTLGMRLVKKTINQDDTSVYHLFYGDEKGNPGTELTFFEIKNAGLRHTGVSSISATSLRVKDDAALQYWQEKLTELGIDHEGIKERAGRKTIYFQDPEGQRLILVSDENNDGVPGGTPWEKSPVPQEKGVRGLGPIRLTVRHPERTAKVLTDLLGFEKVGSYSAEVNGQPDVEVYACGEGGSGAEVHLETRNDLPPERLGRGGVHHVAFRVDDEEELRKWIDRVSEAGFPNSGFVDRFYFRSLYFREPNGILFELATDGPGFDTDEDLEHLGESLALPPFFEDQREEIEAGLTPLPSPTQGK
ncbi:ring-cleaving dioxygenase [Salsuginibacillus kocurii]|uniref:ring-cleaving dioxygenase n=1 Tax=Salsuginibacillus kocurii TaxID=427078 RepID=UPI00036B7D33|nr:ring-cleaving dioxygenase [Salsuginibacillus kocurii]